MSKNRIALVVFSVCIILACSSEEETTGTINGEVYNNHTGSVIAIANVYTEPPSGSVSTDSTGLFSIENVEPGVYRVIAAKFGFDSSSVSVTVTEGLTTTANIPLDPDTLTDQTNLNFQD